MALRLPVVCCLLVALALALLSACARQPPPDLVLVSLDTVRADSFMEVAGRNAILRDIVAGSVGFHAAATPTPLTLPAHVSLMTALNPNRHGIRNNGQRLGAEPLLLAERLRHTGYATGAVVSAFPLDRQFGLARGFDHYDQPEATRTRSEFTVSERGAEASIDAALLWLRQQPQKAFLWLHLFDAHAPYVAPGSDPDLPPRQRYLAEIDHIGNQLGRLVQALRQRGRPFVMVIVADHGEGLGDHNELDHGLLLYDSTVLVPMQWYTSGLWRPRQIDGVPRLIDVAPTLLDIAGAESISDADGESLLPLFEGKEKLLPPAYAETYYPSYAYQYQPLRSMREGRWKSIGTRDRAELYELSSDPGEASDLAGQEVERTAALQLQAWQRPEPRVIGEASAAAIRQLQSLGYIGAGTAAKAEKGHPSEVLSSHRRLVELQNLLGEGRADAALAEAKSLVAAEPENAFAAYVLGMLLLDRGQHDAAIEALQVAVHLDEKNPQARFKLAESLMRADRHAEALLQWQSLELLEPERAAVWINEAASLAALGIWPEARVAIEQALSLAPDDLVALDNASIIAERLGDWASAAQWLSQQAQAEGVKFDQFGRLSLLLVRAERLDEALVVAMKAVSTQPDYPLAQLARALALTRKQKLDEAREPLQQLQTRYTAFYHQALGQFPELAQAMK